MKTKLLLTGLAIIIANLTAAQSTVILGDGLFTGLSNEQDAPFYRSSETSSFDFGKTILLYTQEDLQSVGIYNGATISSFGVFKFPSGEITDGQTAQVAINMNNTANRDLATEDTFTNLTTGATSVFSAPVDNTVFSTASLVEFTLSTPFIYTGGSLEIGLEWDISAVAGNPTTGAFFWRYDEAVTNKARGRASGSDLTGEALTVPRERTYQAQFTFTGGTAPSCLSPVNLEDSNLSQTTAELSWTARGSEAIWNVEVVPAGTIPSGTPTFTGVSNPFTATDLTAGTAYDFYVQADCAGGDTSVNSPRGSFSTLCDAVNAPVTFDFEAGTDGPIGSQLCFLDRSDSPYDWHIGDAGTASGGTGPSAAFGGENYMFIESSDGDGGDTAEIYSPVVNLSTITNPAVSFYYHMYGEAVTALNIDVSSDNGTTFTNVLTISGEQQTAETDAWLLKEINLENFVGQTVIVRFTSNKATDGNVFRGDIAIDDISFAEISTASTDEVLASSLRLYPNPVQGDLINIEMSNPNTQKVTVDVINVTGQKVLSQEFDNGATTLQVANLSSLSNGMYLIKVIEGNQTATLRFVKK